MHKAFMKTFLSLTLSLVIILSDLVFADTVTIGAAPGLGNRTIDTNATTTFLQNQYTGPGIVPNSSVTNNTPIQGVSYDQSAGQFAATIDNNGVSNIGPKTKVITSPGANNAEMNAKSNNSNVIANGATYTGSNGSTDDIGPTVYEISSPTAGGENYYSDNAGPGVETTKSTDNKNASANNSSFFVYPSSMQNDNQNAVGNAAVNNGIIIYTANNNINAIKPNVVAPSAIALNATTRQIYFSKGGFTQYQPASLTNLVTAAILLTYKNLDDVLAVSNTAIASLESGASTAGLKAGDVITVKDAIGAMFVKSCCDVANVVAENVAGNIPNFVVLMNQTVKNWGCIGTNFTNPTGLSNAAQLTNPYDMAIIIDKVSSDPTLKLMLQQWTYQLPQTISRGPKTLKTTNQLLIPGNKHYYAGISASRMGYTSKSKWTIASELDYNGQRLIAVVLHANGSQWDDMTRLLNFAKIASLEATNINAATYNTSLNVGNAASSMNVVASNITANLPVSGMVSTSMSSANSNSVLNSISDVVGTWQKDSKGWYFIKSNGQSASNEWIKQNGKIYCVDSTGYMITGWKQMSNGAVYYFDPTTGELRYSTWLNVSTGAYYLQDDGTLAKAAPGTTKNLVTSVGTYTIDENGKAIAKVS